MTPMGMRFGSHARQAPMLTARLSCMVVTAPSAASNPLDTATEPAPWDGRLNDGDDDEDPNPSTGYPSPGATIHIAATAGTLALRPPPCRRRIECARCGGPLARSPHGRVVNVIRRALPRRHLPAAVTPSRDNGCPAVVPGREPWRSSRGPDYGRSSLHMMISWRDSEVALAR
jgi:hypothetical protein